jgi:GlcNAc-P-P-Und epimerase
MSHFKILVTGGSGFIGTNLIQSLLKSQHIVLNIDVIKPRNELQLQYWVKTDILDYESLEKTILMFNPDYIVHLAARTDLNGKSLKDYSVNTSGTENICKVLSCNHNHVKKIIFTSSMLVCKAGYIPISSVDYCPSTFYGESKVLGEKIILQCSKQLCDWTIIRPTSIWGPWFSTPYIDFFYIVLSKKFIFPREKACKKTYGYVKNSVSQIINLLFDNSNKSNGNIYYLGDEPPINIFIWANEISKIAGLKKTIQVPYFILYILAILGDFLSVFKIRFPMNTFRLRNMTTDNIIPLKETIDICGNSIYDREEGITQTLSWMNKMKLWNFRLK